MPLNLQQTFRIEERELRPVLLALVQGFCIFLAYAILQPVREEISSENAGSLPEIWTGTFVVSLLAVPVYSLFATRLRRGRFLPLVYGFFALNLVLIYALLQLEPAEGLEPERWRSWLDRGFYVWLSVFNLYAISAFWSLLVDVFKNEQGRRLFAAIAVGCTLGKLAGSSLTALAAVPISEHLPFGLLLIAVLPLLASAWTARALDGCVPSATSDAPLAVGVLEGFRAVARSPFLAGIAVYLLLMTLGSTFLYYLQANLVREAFPTGDLEGAARAAMRADRTAFYARMDWAVNFFTLLFQGYLTARILRGIGVGPTLMILPAVALVGFVCLGLWPILGVLVVVQVAARSARYAVGKPTRELLFTVVSREDKYKAKSFLDTAVYRGGDVANGWLYDGLAASLAYSGLAFFAAPVMAVWMVLALILGRKQDRLAAAGPAAEDPAATGPGDPARSG